MRLRMWINRMRELLKRIVVGSPPDDHREKLTEARSRLETETEALDREVKSVGNGNDPITRIIHNIRKVSRDRQ